MTAEQGHAVEEATYEDKLREADRVDPGVNDRSSDYQPDVWNDERSESTTSSGSGTEPRHAVSPDDTSVAQRTEDPEAERPSGR